MGCAQSKIDHEEMVARCNERKLHMDRAVTARNKFAAAHSSHSMSLKNTGAALGDYARGEVVDPSAPGVDGPPPPHESFPPPPPSLPDSEIKRSGPKIEEGDEEEVGLKRRSKSGGGGGMEGKSDKAETMSELHPQPPRAEGAMAAAAAVKKGTVSDVNLLQIFDELDDCFLKASESAREVSRMLETTRLNYHSNFADKRGNVDHSERVMRLISWNRSFRGLPSDDDDEVDDLDSDDHETHATVLNKMLAWEKKLYDEVKAGELMKLEYQKKVSSLHKLKKHGSNKRALEKTKASLSHLHTRYIVDMQSMDSTVNEINRLRDEQLYPMLVSLVDGMATMWETIRLQYENKSKIIQSLRLLDISQLSPKETTDHHHKRTHQLGGVVQEWHAHFNELMSQQKEYIKSLTRWLKLNLIPIDSNLREKVSSPGRPPNPPIQVLLHAWHDYLEKILDEQAMSSINSLAAIIKTIWQHQKEELELRSKCADSRKEVVKKTRDFENWANKYTQKMTPPGEMEPDGARDEEAIAERQMVVEAAKQRLEEEEEGYQKMCANVREKSLMSLKRNLPELFRTLSEFSLAYSDMYRYLKSIAQRNEV